MNAISLFFTPRGSNPFFEAYRRYFGLDIPKYSLTRQVHIALWGQQ